MRIRSLGLVLLVTLAACALFSSKGTMPPPGPNGDVDPSALPDFVAVAGATGIAGYVRKEAVLPHAPDQSWPVYGPDLVTIVGQLVPGKGFVASGVDPASIPTFKAVVEPARTPGLPVPGIVRLDVRNLSAAEVDVVVSRNGQLGPAVGFWSGGYIGIDCVTLGPGSAIVVLSGPPGKPGSVALRTIVIGSESEPPQRWVNISADRAVTSGTGAAEWTSGDSPC